MKTDFKLLDIADIQVNDRTRKHFDEAKLDSLAASIAKLGLLNPVTVDAQHVLIAGERRLRACKKLGMTKVLCQIRRDADDDTAPLMEEHENLERENLTPSEMVEVARRKAKDRPEQTRGPAPEEGSVGRTVLQEAAEATGTSQKTLAMAEKVVLAAEADPKLQPIVDKMDETGNVQGAFEAVAKKVPKIKKGRKKKPKPVRDAKKDPNGVEIPSHLADLMGDPWFDSVDDELDLVAKRLKSLYAIVKAKGGHYRFLQLGEVSLAWEEASQRIVEIRANLGHGRPDYVCPECHGTKKVGNKDCTYCRGSGAVPGHRLKDKSLNG